MGRQKKWLIALCLGLLAFACAGYFGLAFYYRNVFLLNTWINGIYCTGRTVDDVNRELIARAGMPSDVVVTGFAGVGEDAPKCSWTLRVKNMDYTVDYKQSLIHCMESQDPMLWVDYLAKRRQITIEPEVSVNEEAFLKWCEQMESTARPAEEYRIEYAGNKGYYLYDGIHNRLDVSKARQAVWDAVMAGKTQVDLIEEGCYYTAELSAQQEQLYELWQKIDRFQTNGPVYDLGDDPWKAGEASMADLLVKAQAAPHLPALDKKGRLQISEEKVMEFVDALAEEHDTFEKEWKFQSTRGDIVTVPGVTYGSTIDREAERAWLASYLKELAADTRERAAQAAHIPEYTREAFCRSSKSIGDTYVEVDMGIQKLYYYEKGELILETDVVTGNARRRMLTPEGVNYVYSKQRNRVLRGQGYASPVSYWMPVKGNIGLHDAKWRSDFGGDIYKTSGSHGCVNIPKDVMAELYDMVEIGTPVVMFYGEEPQN